MTLPSQIGATYASLVLLKEVTAAGTKRRFFLCRCKCGKEKVIPMDNMRSGHTKTCGCAKRTATIKRNTRHSMYGTATYRSWSGAKGRCSLKNNSEYHNYGGRGIKMSEDWKDFRNFFRDMGAKPANLSLDRIDNNGNYEKGNCRWATAKEQAQNRRTENMVWNKRKQHGSKN